MDAQSSVYRRPLPDTLIPFSSAEGRALFREALEAGTLESFFPLIEQFHTQADPSFCGLASLVMALNSLGIDPGRVWRGPWRWFSEELLDCCTPLEKVRQSGVSLDEVACLARCNGAEATLLRADSSDVAALRAAIRAGTESTDRVLIAAYARGPLGQTGSGHYSPIGGYHAGRDLALVLDVARFKYPPYWVGLDTLLHAMREVDPVTQSSRGWLLLQKRSSPSAIARFLVCRDGMAITSVLEDALRRQMAPLHEQQRPALEDLFSTTALALQASGVLDKVRFRPPETSEHRQLFEQLYAALRGLPLYEHAARQVSPELVVPVVLWLLAKPAPWMAALPTELASELAPLLDVATSSAVLAAELSVLRSQVEFLLDHGRQSSALTS